MIDLSSRWDTFKNTNFHVTLLLRIISCDLYACVRIEMKSVPFLSVVRVVRIRISTYAGFEPDFHGSDSFEFEFDHSNLVRVRNGSRILTNELERTT